MRNARCLSVIVMASALLAFMLFTPITAHATGCTVDAKGCYGNSDDPRVCQWCATTSGNVYGGLTGSVAAPLPSVSMGTRLDGNIKNILYYNPAYPNLCRFVDNAAGAASLFVPQATAEEFGSFAQYAPSTVTLGYCTIGITVTYNGTAHFPNGFWIIQNGGPAYPQPPTSTGLSFQTGTTSFSLPTTRVSNPPNNTPSKNSTLILPAYTRYDCLPATTPSNSTCNPRVVVETQQIYFTSEPSATPACGESNGRTGPDVNCNGSWSSGTVETFSCTVDGVSYGTGAASCLAGYNAPDAVNGQCNNSSQYACAGGTAVNDSDDGTTSTWDCNGSGGGSNATGCSMADASSACTLPASVYSPEDFTNTYDIGDGYYTNCNASGQCENGNTDGCDCYEMAATCLTGTTCYRFDPDPILCGNWLWPPTRVDDSICERNGVYPTDCNTQGIACFQYMHAGPCASGSSP